MSSEFPLSPFRISGPISTPTPEVSNREFVANPSFKKACESVDIPASRRQASKWRQKKGLAYTRGKW